MADNQLLTVNAKNSTPITVCSGCLEQAYVQLTVPPDWAIVKHITFKTVSHDQGFSHEEDRYGGTYEECYSYFDLVVVTPEGHERARWRCQSNRHARRDPFTHGGTWPDQRSEPDIALAIRHIKANDTIQIVPKAHYRAWRNYVLHAEIEIIGAIQATDLATASLIEASAASTPQALYSPLEESRKQIRILELLPGPVDSPVICVLKSTDLCSDDHVEYEALSYCWGNISDLETIQLSGYQFKITSNLHAALKRLRHLHDQKRMIWIDAICINQQDLKERALQVQMMKSVYSMAAGVIVWLGEPELFLGGFEYQQLSVLLGESQLSKKSYEIFFNNEVPIWTQEIATDQPLTVEEMINEIPQGSTGASQLFNFPWFRRVWVLQEVFNAARVAVVCGDQVISWISVLQANVANNRHMTRAGMVMPALLSDLFAITKSSSQGQFGYCPQNPTLDILDLVIAGLDLDATDPRDKLFALLNFSQPSDDFILRADYGKNASDVFRDFTRSWIASRQSLRILSAIHCSVGRTWQRLSPLPVPLESMGRPSWALWYDGKSAWARASLGLSASTDYRAGGDTVPDAELLYQNEDPSVLLLKGVLLGTVGTIGPFPYFNSDQRLSEHRKAYDKLFDPINHRGIFTFGAQGSISKMSDFSKPPLDLIQDHLNAHYEFASKTGGAVECHPDCFFSMSNGMTGLCPSSAREGDLIAVLYGGAVPYIVRSSKRIASSPDKGVNRQVELIGECYLPRYMAGEAVEDADTKVEIFELV